MYALIAGFFEFISVVGVLVPDCDVRQPPLQEVRGHLIDALELTAPALAIELRLPEHRAIFRLDVPLAVPSLREAVRDGIARSNDVVLDVDAEELARARSCGR